MVMEAAPAAALVMPEPKFLLQFLIIAFDAPSELGEFDQALKADVLRQGREPVFGGLLPSGHSIKSHSGKRGSPSQ